MRASLVALAVTQRVAESDFRAEVQRSGPFKWILSLTRIFTVDIARHEIILFTWSECRQVSKVEVKEVVIWRRRIHAQQHLIFLSKFPFQSVLSHHDLFNGCKEILGYQILPNKLQTTHKGMKCLQCFTLTGSTAASGSHLNQWIRRSLQEAFKNIFFNSSFTKLTTVILKASEILNVVNTSYHHVLVLKKSNQHLRLH